MQWYNLDHLSNEVTINSNKDLILFSLCDPIKLCKFLIIYIL